MSSNEVRVAEFELVPANGETTFYQQIKGKSPEPIETDTFVVLLVAATKCVDHAKVHQSEEAQKRAKENYEFYANQVDMEQGDAFALFMTSSNEWMI